MQTSAESDIQAVLSAVVKGRQLEASTVLAWLVMRQASRNLGGFDFETFPVPAGIDLIETVRSEAPIKRSVAKGPGQKRKGPGRCIPLRVVKEAVRLMKTENLTVRAASTKLDVPYQSLWRAINHAQGRLGSDARLLSTPETTTTLPTPEPVAGRTNGVSHTEAATKPSQFTSAKPSQLIREVATKLGISYSTAWRRARTVGVDKFLAENG